ncbi:Glyceraldehyde-3-phosphate dehydrogenase [Theileria parva strain Muguga]|uniref:glyceraldehyde-3-phosphate dehydrogenase (NADP(+)) (phosphorylating) n=1 Tax=Theileria parva TaxID=5875 RepID=Q4N3Y0_THEPA|nr:Glyceraldehyde-3-phosphate dehydrogenase [Theileria parva strain Muguga]EAN33143.1 Glyceraldehyde-3-phosphate dehydrogenase [Theileria parva strain Muguga]|eukprot:XP_765426.1 glyceraldehyde-3-phosphate dehydrogenase [Theileria parva strain Muguga]
MDMIKIGINGYGRIGRSVHRAALLRDNIQVVHINDPSMTPEYVKYLLQYDSVYGKLPYTLLLEENFLLLNNTRVNLTFERDPGSINWTDTDVVLECTGIFKTTELSTRHLDAGAKLVIISAIPLDNTPLFVYGINHTNYDKSVRIMSNASCTANCLAPVVKVLHENFGVQEALVSAIWPNMARQNLIDSVPRPGEFARCGRTAGVNIAPVPIPAAEAVARVIPGLNGKLKGISFFVPVHAVAAVDLTVKLINPTTYDQICTAIKRASEGELRGILGYTEEQVVSSDFIEEKRSSVFDTKAGIQLNETFVKLVSWYHNEFGYSNRLLDLAQYVVQIYNS